MSPSKEHLDEIFTYHKPGEEDIPKYEAIRSKARELAHVIVDNTPGCADQSAAIRKLREAVMTANSAIALKGIGVVLLAIVLCLASVSSVAAAPEKPNRLRGTYGRLSVEASDLFGEPHADVVGANYERLVGESVGFQVEAYRPRDGGDWTGALDLTGHPGPFVVQVGVDYADGSELWYANVGAGLDLYAGPLTAQIVARYHKELGGKAVGVEFDDYHVTLQGGIGIRW